MSYPKQYEIEMPLLQTIHELGGAVKPQIFIHAFQNISPNSQKKI